MQGRVYDAQPHQELIDQAIGLQQHDPGGDPYQHRGPERQQHQDHQQVGGTYRQGSQQVGQRIGQQQTAGGDHQTHPEGAKKDILIDGLFGGHRHYLTGLVMLQIQRGEQVVAGIGRAVTVDGLPVGQLSPARIQLDHGRFPGFRRRIEGQTIGTVIEQAAITGDLVVQSLTQITQLVRLAGTGYLFGQGVVGGVIRQRLAIPVAQGGDGIG